MFPTSKYNTLTTDGKGNPLHFPGTIDGFPVRGAAPTSLRQEEYEALEHDVDFQARVFKLPEDMSAYVETKDRIANGMYQREREEIHFIPGDKCFVVFLSWFEIYGKYNPRPGARQSEVGWVSDRPSR